MIGRVFTEFKRVRFFDNEHRYFLENSEMKSVTSVIKEYGNKFNTDYWSTYKALEALGYKVYPAEKGRKIGVNGRPLSLEKCKIIEGVTDKANDLKSEWADKSKKAREFGSAVHKYMEDAVWGKYSDDPDPVLDEVIIDILTGYDPIRTEMIVYNEEVRVAGQVDLLAISKSTEGFYILDYKTDEEIQLENKYDNFKAPIDSLEESSFNKYTLQLNMYRRLLELKEVKIEGMWIIHLCKNPKWYKIPLLSVKELLNDYDKKRTVYV